MSGQNGADLLGLREGLVQFHAGAAGVGKNGVHILALQRGHEDLATFHGAAEFEAGGGLGFALAGGFAHGSLGWAAGGAVGLGERKRPTTVSSRGSLSKVI